MTEKFHWTSPEGVEIVLPYMGSLPGKLLRTTRKLEPLDALYTTVESFADEKLLEQIDAVSIKDQNDLFGKWQEASSLGES